MSNEQETTAALIARLHNELELAKGEAAAFRNRSEALNSEFCSLVCERDAYFAATSKAQDERDQARAEREASKAECLQWRKDIDIERSEVSRLGRQLESTKSMLAERSGQSDGWFKACKQAEKERDEQIRGRAAFQQHCADSANKYAQERDEQRARAEKAEGELIKARYECRAELVAMRQSLDIAHRNIDEDAKERYAIGQLVGAPEIGVELREHIADVMAGLRTQNNLQRMEIVQLQSSIDEARANFVTVDRMLVERTREREEARERIARALVREEGLIRTEAAVIKELDEARADSLKAGLVGREMAENLDAVTTECLKAQRLAKEAGADCERALKERDEAREQLAKLEWTGLQRVNAGSSLLHACPICDGLQPDEDVRRSFKNVQIGHRPTCWFVLERNRKTAENVDSPRKPGKTRNHRQECPARTAEDVAWVGSQWHSPGKECDIQPVKGPRPKPIGCDGCKCEKPRALREQWKVKRAHYDHWADAFSYMLLGVDWAEGNSVTIKTDRPVQPGATFVHDQSSGIWKLVDKQPAKEPARPEPRFKVGEKVIVDDRDATVAWVTDAEIQVQFDGTQTLRTFRPECVRPAPKFAVGEWVTHHAGDFEVRRSSWEKDCGWIYDIARLDLAWRARESDLTAQTPQHAHDCKGCVFLGRMGEADLYWCQTHSGGAEGTVSIGYYHLAVAGISAEPVGKEMTEARRRAVARGLI